MREKAGLSCRQLVCVVISACLLSSIGWGQIIKSSILGTVRDPSGAVIPGVTVTVTHVGTRLSRQVMTDDRGEFIVDLLDSGVYSVAAEQPGFKRAVEPGAVLDVATKLRVDLALQIGEPSETIEVRSAVPLVQTEDTTLAQTFKAEQMSQLPLLGRNYQQFSLLMPTAVEPLGTFLTALFPSTSSETQPTIAGQRGASVAFTIDGIASNSLLMGNQSLIPSVDAIQEFRVQSHNFQAEFGSGGVQFTLAIKSGTNDFHGALYEYHRNDALNANSFFNNRLVQPDPNPLQVGEESHFIRNQFGGNIDGPIVPNRTFFFFSYEGTRLRQDNIQSARTLEPEWLQGDFSALPTPIIDPLTQEPFPGNIIPTSRIHPTVQPALPFFLTRNVSDPATLASLPGGRNYVGSARILTDPNFWTVKVDHEFSERDRINGRYMQSLETWRGASLAPISGRTSQNQGRNIMFSYTHIFSPRVLNEIRVGYNRQ